MRLCVIFFIVGRREGDVIAAMQKPQKNTVLGLKSCIKFKRGLIIRLEME